MLRVVALILLFSLCAAPAIAGRQTRPSGDVGALIQDPKTGASAQLDDSTSSIQTITYEHHEVHAGKFFRSGMNYALGNGEVATFAIVTPNTTTWAHVVWELTTTSDGAFAVLEDVTSFTGGAAVTPLNHNRNSQTASTMTCTRGMTGADLIAPTGGTTILSASLATGKGVVVARGAGEEFILKQNSKYLFRYTNGTSANTIRLVMEWYEHAAHN